MHFAMANSPESGMHSAVALIVSCRECTTRERIAKRGAPTAWNALRRRAHPKARSGICIGAGAATRSFNRNPHRMHHAEERTSSRGAVVAPAPWGDHPMLILFLKSVIVRFVLSTEQFLRFHGIDPVCNVQAKPLGEVLLERYPLSFVLHRFGPGANAK